MEKTERKREKEGMRERRKEGKMGRERERERARSFNNAEQRILISG